MANGGFYISSAKAFILVFLALAVAVGVGIIVHFAGPAREVECRCSFPTTDNGNSGGSTAALEQCKDWASDGNTEICKFSFFLFLLYIKTIKKNQSFILISAL
jgi:hypothetical protein